MATNASHNQRKADVRLSPYGNYTFRVLARNKIGLSQPSLHTRNVCRTMEDVPEKNPENVIGEGDEPDNLVIYWTVRDRAHTPHMYTPPHTHRGHTHTHTHTHTHRGARLCMFNSWTHLGCARSKHQRARTPVCELGVP